MLYVNPSDEVPGMHETTLSTPSAQYREVELSTAAIEYRDEGHGPALVLVHGLLVNGRIWDRLLPLLTPGARCIVPELPLGSHTVPVEEGLDLTPTAVAGLIAELLERLDLDEVTLVGNDTGGALSQLVAADHSERISALVLTNCDAFEHFPPGALKPFVNGLRLPGIAAGAGALGRFRRGRGLISALKLTLTPIDDELVRSWMAPLGDRRIRADLKRFARAIPATDLVAAAERLRSFDRPALLAWATRDPYFPIADAERLAAVLPQARLERIDDASTFVQLDAPERLAELILEHVDAPGATAPVPQAAR
jgi:pimeloyl-ACP methyl ester carboxylesterase